MKEIQICAEKYLKEFEGSSELHSLATKVLKDLKNMYTQLHEEWCRDLQVIKMTIMCPVYKYVQEFSFKVCEIRTQY